MTLEDPKENNNTVLSNPPNDEIPDSIIDDTKSWNCDFSKKETILSPNPNFPSILLITGLPQISKNREEKLIKAIRKKIKDFAKVKKDKIRILFDTDCKKSRGCALLFFDSYSEAKAASKMTKFDKNFTVTCFVLGDIITLPKKLESSKKTIETINVPNLGLYAHNQDSRQRCQYLIREGEHTRIFWNDPLRAALDGLDPYIAYDEKNSNAKKTKILQNTKLTASMSFWSPSGAFLGVVKSKKSFDIYGGQPMVKLFTFPHENFYRFGFSPKENFVMTSNSISVKIWDFAKQTILLELFEGVDYKGNAIFEWSFDDSFFAFSKENFIYIYETKTMKLVQNKPISANFIKAYKWAPDSNLLALTTLSEDKIFSKLSLFAVPSLKSLIVHIFHGAPRVRIHWAASFLVAELQTFSLKKMPKHVSFEFFGYKSGVRNTIGKGERLEFSKDIMANFSIKDKHEYPLIVSSKFSPKGEKLAIICLLKQKNCLVIYGLQPRPKRIFKINYAVNSLYWSPCGTRLAVVGLGCKEDICNGAIIIIDIKTLRIVKRLHHSNCNAASWSPCGRFFATCYLNRLNVPSFKSATCSYNIYDQNGQTLGAFRSAALFTFLWRPREKILPYERRSEIASKLANYRDQFKEQDEEIVKLNLSKEKKYRINMLDSFREAMGKISSAAQLVRNRRKSIFDALILSEFEEEIEDFEGEKNQKQNKKVENKGENQGKNDENKSEIKDENSKNSKNSENDTEKVKK